MNKSDFDDDHQSGGTLPRWATITQVSLFLGIPREAVRSAVRRAIFNGEAWVKKETSEGRTVYLIDTEHETYQAHEERWKQPKALRTSVVGNLVGAWSPAAPSPFFSLPQADSPSSASPPRSHVFWSGHDNDDIGLHRWPLFRRWLYGLGLQVFKNILAEEWQEKPWQWRWNELHGEGYPSDEEAIIAALQMRLDTYE